jgi:L-fuculose-phosphate aldolase
MLARGLGRVNYFTEPEAQSLLELKEQWGLSDPRNEMKNCDICANDVFRDSWKASGVEPTAFQPPHYAGSKGLEDQTQSSGAPSRDGAGACHARGRNGSAGQEQESLIQAITDRVMAELTGR